MPVLYLNGEFTDLDSARISVEDRGFQFADGIYEVVRVYGGRPFRLRDHLARLAQSAAGLELPAPDPSLHEACLELTRRSGIAEGTIYLQMTRGVSPRSHAWSDPEPTTLAYLRELHLPDQEAGYRVVTVPDDRWGRCHLKTIALLPNVLARQKAARAGCQEAVFVRDGIVTEGAASNVFVVRRGRISTHPADHRILSGVTRSLVISLAGEVDERPVPLSEALEAEEIFLTGTTTEVTGVVSIDGRPFGGGVPGPVTRRLRKAFQDLRRRECGS